MTSSIVPMVFAPTELNLKGQAELLPLIYEAHNVKIMVRPQHPVTKHALTSKGEVAKRLPLCSDLLHTWAIGLVMGNPMALTKMDPCTTLRLSIIRCAAARSRDGSNLGLVLAGLS